MSEYKLPSTSKCFSYSPQDLFDCVVRIIAHPHKTITDHDRARAMAIFVTLSDYLDNYTQSDNNGGHYVYESWATDFEAFVMEKLNKSYHDDGPVSAEEVLKLSHKITTKED